MMMGISTLAGGRSAGLGVSALLLGTLSAAPLGAQLARPTSDYAGTKGDVYTVDNTHSLLDFTVRLIGFNRVRGTFKSYRADMYFVADDITQSSVSFMAAINSVDTGDGERDEHLKSADFFDAEEFPYMEFHSERVETSDDGFVAIGPLTIRDSTHMVELPFEVSDVMTDPFGNKRVFFVGRVSLKRKDYGVVGPRFWNNAVSNNVDIEFEMAGRLWDWTKLGWGSPERLSIGKVLMETIDAEGIAAARNRALAIWQEHSEDDTHNFGAFEFMKAAGRLQQRGHLYNAAAALELGIEMHGGVGHYNTVAALRSMLGGVYAKLGRGDDAVAVLEAALESTPNATYAKEWLRHLY
jgi:polyisoprenoid-binding protein YceI